MNTSRQPEPPSPTTADPFDLQWTITGVDYATGPDRSVEVTVLCGPPDDHGDRHLAYLFERSTVAELYGRGVDPDEVEGWGGG